MLVAACGGDDDPFADADPRCRALCTIETPSLDGAFDICSTASAGTCVDLCEARIAGTETLCATCLLEDADFGTDDAVSPGDFCENGTCTVLGRTGECTYPEGDQAARENCLRQVSPRREVACETEFEPVSECASTCG